MSRQEASDLLDCSTATTRRWAKANKLDCFRRKGRLFYRAKDIRRLKETMGAPKWRGRRAWEPGTREPPKSFKKKRKRSLKLELPLELPPEAFCACCLSRIGNSHCDKCGRWFCDDCARIRGAGTLCGPCAEQRDLRDIGGQHAQRKGWTLRGAEPGSLFDSSPE